MNRSSFKQQGLTLIEVSVAIAIMAIVYVLSQQAISIASASYEVSEKHSERIESIDQAWFLIKQDLRNILSYKMSRQYQDTIPPLVFEFGQETWLSLLRGSNPNPLSLLRTELQRVAYKLDEDVIVRYTWNDPAETDFEEAYEQKILSGVEKIEVRGLPPKAQSLKDRWVSEWKEPESLPLALEVTITLEDRGEMKRLFMLSDGK